MPAHTRVQAKHRRTTEDDARQMILEDSINAFQSNHLPLASSGTEHLDRPRSRCMRRLWLDNSRQCSRLTCNARGPCNDLASMGGCRRVRRGWRQLRSTGPSSRWRGETPLWGIGEWLTWRSNFVLEVSYFAAAHIHPQGQTCTMHSISWLSLTVNSLLNWHQDEYNHKSTPVHPFLTSHRFSWFTPLITVVRANLCVKLHLFERWNLKAWTLILW